jgi:hypothetical protein
MFLGFGIMFYTDIQKYSANDYAYYSLYIAQYAHIKTKSIVWKINIRRFSKETGGK